MMSEWTKKYPPFSEVKLYLTNTNDPAVFKPDNQINLYYPDYQKYFLNAGKTIKGLKTQDGVMNENTLLSKAIITDADPTGDAPQEGCYEQIFNTPAYKNGHKCPFIQGYKGRARQEAKINGEKAINDDEAIKRSFAWETHFDESEYKKYSIPTTPLVQNTTCLTANNLVVSAKEKFSVSGALLTVKISQYLFPISFIYWDNPSYYNQYVFNWNTNGIFQVK